MSVASSKEAMETMLHRVNQETREDGRRNHMEEVHNNPDGKHEPSARLPKETPPPTKAPPGGLLSQIAAIGLRLRRSSSVRRLPITDEPSSPRAKNHRRAVPSAITDTATHPTTLAGITCGLRLTGGCVAVAAA